jgi:hypothetical protein
MSAITPAFLCEQIDLADQLLAGRETMLDPQDLPGRYGGVVKAVDHLLQVTGTQAVLGGGWAVWRHGYSGRLMQDIDIVLPADRIDEFLRVASVTGFEVLPQPEGRWPKVRHKESNIKVNILPEGGRPGTAAKPSPTTIPHPATLGAAGSALRYITLPALVELKIAAGRARDEADIIELIRVNMDQVDEIHRHLAGVHGDYARAFDHLVSRAREQEDQ